MKIKIISLLLVISFLVACGSESGSEQVSYNFKQGSSGLVLNFVENAPPEKVYPNSDFKIIIKAENQAAYDLTNVKVNIIGLDPKYFGVYPLEQSFDTLAGKSLVNPSGDTKYLEFEVSSKELFQNAEQYLGNYFLKVSYNSKVEFVDTICINPNLYDVYDAGCKIESPKTYSGQGAPFGVGQMEELAYPGSDSRVEFRLLLQNFASGKVKKVVLNDAKLGGEEIECIFQGTDSKEMILDYQKQEIILFCKKKLRETNSYSTSLFLDLSYEYETKEQHSLLMMK